MEFSHAGFCRKRLFCIFSTFLVRYGKGEYTIRVSARHVGNSARLLSPFEELRSGVTQMNIVDVIKSQLSGEVIAKLSSLVGESEDKTKAAVVGAAVPGLLSVLASLATSGGADKLINALKQVD